MNMKRHHLITLGSLLKAMENPQNYIQLKEKKHANTLRQTGGLAQLLQERI